MDNRFNLPHRLAQDAYPQARPRGLGLDTSVVMSGTSTDMISTTKPSSGKFNEKELMRGLNDRLAGFIEKVHTLEHQNHLLEREIGEIRGKAKPASCLEEEYGPELRNLRQLVQDISHQKHQIEMEHRNLEEDLSNLRRQHEQEARSRSDAESNIMVLKKDISDAYQAKLQLDKKAQSLVDEIHFLKKNHEAEVSEMFDQIQDAQGTLRAHQFGHPGVTAALRDIRAQLEGHAMPDVQQIGETFRSQFARLTEAAETKREAIKATQQEIQEYRRRMQAKNIELDCAKGTREALEKQLHDVEDRHKEEIIHYQNTIKELENELINCKFDMSGYLREYQDLLNVKMALDVEILSYRKLLCGEEARLSTMSDTHISLPYIYHQSPIYTLPCHSRPGGPHRRAEPHYKFVEEIITETTREIEMSEFEETGSEETEVGKDEQECTKSERGGSKEEVDNQDSGEDEGNQVSDGQQDQVASDGAAESPGEVDDGGEKRKEESEEAEGGDDEGDSGMDENTQDKEEENEQQQLAENTEEKADLSSKPGDLKPEGERLNTSDGAKLCAEEDRSAAAKKPVDETSAQVSEESEKTQELNSVQDRVNTEVSETAEKTTGFTADPESTPAQVTSSTAPETEGKKNIHAGPKETSNSGEAEGEDKVAKSIQDAKPESNKDRDQEVALKSIVKSLPEVEGPQANSGDKTQTVPPKEKTTVTAEGSHQGAPAGSQVQKPKLSEDSENK